MKQAFAIAVVVCLAFTSARSQVSTALPDPWRSQDIGVVGQSGSASQSGGVFTVSGGGADVWGTADAFHFVYRPLVGDGTIVAEVASIVGSRAWTKMGVMIRASANPNAAHAFMLVSSGKGLAFQRRRANGAISTHTAGGPGTAPRWVKLTRAGATITAYASIDGQAWTRIGSDTFSMPATVLVGLAASSHDTTRLATAMFDHVSVSVPAGRPNVDRLQVTTNRRYLQQHATGRHFFYLADTAWGLFKRLDRADADVYLKDVAAKGFNAVQAVALWNWNSSGAHNAYGDHPLVRVNNRYDPAQPVTTPGSDPADPLAYDFWDHVDYVVDRAAHHGLYVMFQPTWGNYVSGTNSYALDMSSNVFTTTNARTYGEFLGRRYGARTNMIWMLGGDRSAVYANGDFRRCGGAWPKESVAAPRASRSSGTRLTPHGTRC
jgi:regulation of enolase protein 1 (concanavalin A-like superfamily)